MSDHFVAYHNPDAEDENGEKRGRYEPDEPVTFWSGKSSGHFRKMLGGTVWIFTSAAGQRNKRYYLVGRYTPDGVAENPEGGWLVSGPGIHFPDWLDVTDQSWFRQLLRKQGNFGVGLGVPIHGSDVIQELLRLTHAGTHDDRIAEEVSEQMYSEGRAVRVAVNRYERDRDAREACLAAHGQICCVCRVDLAMVYGSTAVGLIHVHHLTPLSEVGPEYQVNAITDLVPVCPNCHAVMHRTEPPLTPAQLRAEMGRSTSESS